MKKWIMFVCLCFLITGCEDKRPEGVSLQNESKSNLELNQKKVIAIIIDSMTSELLETANRNGKVPALSFLLEHGHLHKDIIAPFPTMSVVIESTLVTGTEPDIHKVPGLIWYDVAENRLVNYGSTVANIFKIGSKQVLEDALFNLNNTHLNPDIETVFEVLQKHGYTTGAVNTLVYRGNTEHEITLPAMIRRWSDNSTIKTKGPDILSLGQAVKPKVVKEGLKDRFYQRYGMNDSYSSGVVEQLITSNQQPDFLMVFLPDFDKKAHIHGPNDVTGFAEADYFLQKILNSFDSWDQALDETTFIIFGDHGQDAIIDDKGEAAIELEPLLEPYCVAPLLDEPASGDLIVANNHRMVYIYNSQKGIPWVEVIPNILTDHRIDHTAYLMGDELIINRQGYIGALHIKKGKTWSDEFNQTWDINGNPRIADATLDPVQHEITYGDYPDIFNQLFHALNSHSTPLVVTAKPGYVIKTEASPVHANGGEHGGLHMHDSHAAMVIAGTQNKPRDRRMTEFKPYILSLFGIKESE